MKALEAFFLGIVLLCLLAVALPAMGNPGKFANAMHYLQTGQTSLNYHQLARQDAINSGIDPDLFERQINQESGFRSDAVSSAGAIGIAQIMPSTAAGWGVNPHDPVASLSAASSAMARYYAAYQNYRKALAAYNAGSATLNTAISNCGWGWETCVPAETQRYIHVIMDR
jgi:soluble lytic murein transglycosylase-like protein